MAKKTNKQLKNKPAAAQKPEVSKKSATLNGPLNLRVHLLIIAGISALTGLSMGACVRNQLGLWDDTPYIKDNWLVKNVAWDGIKNIFATPCMGNYHPLTILSYAMEYSAAKLEPWLYHFDNLALHIGVAALVYWLVLLLSRRNVAAVAAAVLFGIHPMHVESVAWVAARKDLLSALFYMAACIAYVYYHRADSRKWAWYVAVLVLFLCALMSKAITVTLPLSMLLIDYFEGRRLNFRSLLEKVPHFVLALIFGIIALRVQHVAGAMEMHKVAYSPAERLALGCYALTTYLWKAIAPVQLHCLYPYPDKTGGALPYFYYIYPLIIALTVFLVWRLARKNKAWIFGLLFFLANIVLLLQFIPVGDAIVAERYSYIPYFGLFFIAGWYISGLFETGAATKYRTIILAALLGYTCWLGYTCNERCAVWYDEMSLWRDETEKVPVTGVRGYHNLGYLYFTKWSVSGDPAEKKVFYDSAAYYMNKAIELMPDFVNPYMALGDMERSAGRFAAAKSTYLRALKRFPKEGNLYFGMAIVYYTAKSMDSAGYYFRKVLEVAPSAQAHGNYGNYLSFIGKDDSALVELTKAVSLTKEDYIPYMNRGNLYRKMNKWAEARKDYQDAIMINPDAGQLYYWRSFCDTQQHQFSQAVADIDKAVSLGFKQVDMGYYNGLKGK